MIKAEKRNSRKGSVLVVDDEEIMREVLETLLTNEGYRVDLAKTGEEGLEAYGRRAFDVVLLDVSMPGRSCVKCSRRCSRMRAIEWILPRPVRKVSRLTGVARSTLCCSTCRCRASAAWALSKRF